ncbi:helix-turn-helix transcriptional regulator [Methylocaldum sp.]|uniref:helix-turn-helix transcriptional regulator n=1 Tax=Methylocaldum sp. TaxID=1969727 RepID=UPI00322091B0
MVKDESDTQNMMTVPEVARYLRLKERKIYDLLAQKRIPCTRVTGKWLFPKEQIDIWLKQNSEFQVQPGAEVRPLPQVVVGSHDPLLEWALGETGYPLAMQMNGSTEGLERFAADEGVLCGIHLLDPASDEYNLPAVKEHLKGAEIVVLHWAWREQGLVLPAGNPLGIRALSDLARTRARIIERQEGAGSRLLFRHLLKQSGLSIESLNLLSQPARGHVDIGLAVCSGQADAGIAVQSVARQMKLEFLTLARERFDLVIRRRDYFEPPFQTLLKFTRAPEFAEKAQSLGGYDIGALGEVLYNSP